MQRALEYIHMIALPKHKAGIMCLTNHLYILHFDFSFKCSLSKWLS